MEISRIEKVSRLQLIMVNYDFHSMAKIIKYSFLTNSVIEWYRVNIREKAY
mgnify:CR=1 FL=1